MKQVLTVVAVMLLLAMPCRAAGEPEQVEGLDELCGILEQIIRSRRVHLEKVYPYSQAGRIQTIRKYGQLLKEEYTEDGIAVEAYVPAELFAKLYAD